MDVDGYPLDIELFFYFLKIILDGYLPHIREEPAQQPYKPYKPYKPTNLQSYIWGVFRVSILCHFCDIDAVVIARPREQICFEA